MGVIIRQSFKSTLVTYFGVALGAINLLYFFPKFLTAEEIGLRDLVVSIATSLSFFTHLGLHSSMLRFFPYFKDESRQHNGFLLFCLLLATAGLLLFGSLFTLFKAEIMAIFNANAELFNRYVWLVVPATAFIMYQNILEMWSRIHLRIVANALVREVFLRVTLTLLVVAYATELIDFDGFVVGFVGTYALSALFMLGYLKAIGVLYLSPKYLYLKREVLVDMGRYSAWMMVGGAGTIISDRIDGVMLAWLAGLSLTGIYSISYFMGTIIEMPKRAISQISSSLIAQYWKDRDFTPLGRLYKQTGTNQIILGGLLFLLIWSNIDAIFNLIPNGDLYRAGKYVVLFIGLAKLIDMFSSCNNEIILYSPYFRFNLVSIVFLSMVSFGTNYFMIPRFGLVGAAAGSTLSILLFNLAKSGFIWYKLRMHPFSAHSWKILLLLVFTYLCGLLLPEFDRGLVSNLFSITLRSALLALILGFGVWRWQLSDELMPIFTKFFHRIGIFTFMQRLQK